METVIRSGPPAIAPDYPPRLWLELWFFAQMFYAIMGAVLGVSIDSVGAVMMLLLGAVCFARAGSYWTTIVRTAALPLGCAASFIFIQMFVYGESLRDTEPVKGFIIWMVSLFILHYLALARGFFHRFALAIFLTGVSTTPYLQSFRWDSSRTALDHSIAISNPNDLGAWFGFCVVYFLILGLETKRHWLRAISWTVAVGCLFIVGMTGSRGPLFAMACSLAVAYRRVLKRGFFPFLALIVAGWVAYVSGIFGRSTELYEQRAYLETGRFLVWPLAFGRFLASPFVGVGLKNLATYIPDAQASVTPHNGVLMLALSSGVVPLAFFLGYWVQLFRNVLKPVGEIVEDAPFLTSLVLYSFLIMLNLNEAYKQPWMLAVFAGIGRGIQFKVTAAKAAQHMRRLQRAAHQHARVPIPLAANGRSGLR